MQKIKIKYDFVVWCHVLSSCIYMGSPVVLQCIAWVDMYGIVGDRQMHMLVSYINIKYNKQFIPFSQPILCVHILYLFRHNMYAKDHSPRTDSTAHTEEQGYQPQYVTYTL
jgi:uncharacterized membrane protein